MSQLVSFGGNCICTFGTNPAPIRVTSQQKVMTQNGPAVTITDSQAGANIGPFGMCSSLANPQVAAATAAALGVLTPQPCMPVPAGTWIPTKPKILIGGKPCLTQDCKMMCAYGGQISITTPGQMKASAK